MGTNTGIGIGIGIPFKNNALGGDGPYLPPELKARLIGVWDNYGKKNTDADRNIIKNKIPNAGGDLEILNAAYEGMSGYNGYPVIFGMHKTWKNVPTYNSIYNINDNKIHFTKILVANNSLIFSYVKQNDQLYDITEIPSFKIRISGLKGDSKVRYSYIKTENAVHQTLLDLDNGIHELPKSLAPTNSISNNSWIGFAITPMIEGELVFDCDITIEILPEYEGAFVTDGVNDMIISQKTLQEMGVTKDFTIVSMIHQIALRGTTAAALTNYIRQSTGYEYVRNHVADIGKTGIYGYVVYDVNHSSASNSHIINTILGDKNDYSIHITGNLSQGKFSVQGYINGEDNIVEISKVAHYWTFALLGKATEDDINLIIGYFNLDRTLKADIYCNIEKQGLTNENHAEFGDKLIDFSGNGRDIQLNNIAWDGDSGIGKYNYPNWKVNVTQGNKYARIVYYDSINGTYSANFKGMTDLYKSYGLSIEIRVNRANTIDFHSIKEDGIYTVTPPDDTTSIDICFGGENVYNASCDITITQIPSYAGALCLDGVNDFGKVTGMPIYKDYTFIIEREFLNETFSNQVCLVSKSKVASEIENGGAFIVDNIGVNSIINPYSFYKTTSLPDLNTFDRQIVFQSKYKYLDKDIAAGTSTDSDTLWLGTFRDNDSRFANVAIYSLMSFPYSMSEFLIERQLKKHKLGTLYPDMVEFRPIVKSNLPYSSISYSVNPGEYISVDSMVTITVTLSNTSDELMEVSCNAISGISISGDNGVYEITGKVVKSPQKINITIDEYIRYEDIV